MLLLKRYILDIVFKKNATFNLRTLLLKVLALLGTLHAYLKSKSACAFRPKFLNATSRVFYMKDRRNLLIMFITILALILFSIGYYT
jgi:hypothetical protein